MGKIGVTFYSEEYWRAIKEAREACARIVAVAKEVSEAFSDANIAAAAEEVGKAVYDAITAATEAISQVFEESPGIFEKLAEEFLPEYDDAIEWERAEWRDAGLLAAQKAAARAKDYGLRLTLEKALEIRRGRKWRKRIDDRVYLIR